MSAATEPEATIDDLSRVDAKAELIDGRIVHFMASGPKPSRIALRIARSLDDFAETTGAGEAYTDNIGFTVPRLSSGRQSFSPDASYFLGPFPADEIRFLERAPTFAVEVRGEGDHGESAEAEMAAKRADYFEVGTRVVWDVDPIGEFLKKYRSDLPDRPETFFRGQVADAEPAEPGWGLAADRIFG